jgi:hypothetical protein
VTVNEFKKEVERLYEKWHKKIAPKDLTHYVVWNEHLEKAEGISGCTHTLTWVPNRVIFDAKIVSEKEAERIEEANTCLVDRAIWAAYHMEPEEE